MRALCQLLLAFTSVRYIEQTWTSPCSLLWGFTLWTSVAYGMTDDKLAQLRQETREIFYHGYHGYMDFAYPEDELRPLSCTPLTRDREDPTHIEINDVLGNYSLTLIDSLSTLAVLASDQPDDGRNYDLEEFQEAVDRVAELYGDGTDSPSGVGQRAHGFNIDSKVQVFETVIRGVGGLLSAHLFATGDLPIKHHTPIFAKLKGREVFSWDNDWIYDGHLLRLALDLATRLLPAFTSPTGLPYPRVNLRDGIPFYPNSLLHADKDEEQCQPAEEGDPEITETCTAGAGSLVLEFSILSRLVGDDRFEILAKRAFWAVWERRSAVGLVGGGVDAESGLWVSPYTGIGAGIDSFFEYAFKTYVLLSGTAYNEEYESMDSPDAFLRAWNDAHAAINRHVYRGHFFHKHPHYPQVDLFTGAVRAYWIDSLSAYYPGLLAFAGHLNESIETHLLYAALWTRYSAMPERWSISTGKIEGGLGWWGGRPEFIESTWYLYRATHDPWYLYVGEMVLRDIKRRCWAPCGWTGLQDVQSGQPNDRMESFFLGETTKYLFLLFSPDHPLNTMDAPIVFTTEGHPLILPKAKRRSTTGYNAKTNTSDSSSSDLDQCPPPPAPLPFSVSVTAARSDIFYAAGTARLPLGPRQLPKGIEEEDPYMIITGDPAAVPLMDVDSPSNHSWYPWTLPPDFMPSAGQTVRNTAPPTFELSFPPQPNLVRTGQSLLRTNSGFIIQSMSGLRLSLVKDTINMKTLDNIEHSDVWRIQALSSIFLGRDEKVFLSENAVEGLNPADAHFTRVRDTELLDLILDIPAAPSTAAADLKATNANASNSATTTTDGSLNTEPDIEINGSLISSLIQGFKDFGNMLTDNILSEGSTQNSPAASRHQLTAVLGVGPGATPPGEHGELGSTKDLTLPWRNIYLAGELCNERLPLNIARHFQVLVLKRGGCSFSRKMRNIPAFIPDERALQVVVVVSYPDFEDEGAGKTERLSRPLMDQVQMTPGGMHRPFPIPLIMVDGGNETYQALAKAHGLGIRRRWHYLSQGLLIENLIVL